MKLQSLDPRISRLELKDGSEKDYSSEALDQLITFEVFVQPIVGKPFQHEGIVHASDEDMAFVFAKEQFSRRDTCVAMKIVKTENVFTSPVSENNKSVYEMVDDSGSPSEQLESYTVFHLLKRGKQHVEAGDVEAGSFEHALSLAKVQLAPEKPVYNVWVVKKSDTFIVGTEYGEIWDTLPEKKFRDAIAYKGSDKIKAFKEQRNQQK